MGSEWVPALVAFAIVGTQTATGAAWWWMCTAGRRRRVSVLELAGVGMALGTLAAMLSAVLLVATPVSRAGWAIPTIATAIVLAVCWRRLPRARVTLPPTQFLALALGVGAAVVLAWFNWRRIPLDNPTATSFTDLYFFEALGRGIAQWGPAESIFMSGGSIRYHWFTYAWAGQLEQAAGAPPFLILTRVLPVVVSVGVACVVAAWAARLTRVRWVPSLAVLLVVVGGYTGALYGTVLNYDSPSQSMTTLWLLAFAVVYLSWTTGAAPRWVLMLVALLGTGLTGGKVSHAVVAAGGILLVIVGGMLFRQTWWRRAAIGGVLTAATMAATYLVVLAGVAVNRNLTEEAATKASTWQGLDPFIGRLGVALGTVALILAIAARLGGLGWLAGTARGRRDPAFLFASGGVLVGLAAMVLLSEGVNELWFILAASAPASVVSAVGVGRALRHTRAAGMTRPLAVAIVVAVPASAVTLILTRNWTEGQSLLNWLAPIAAWILVPVAAAVSVAVVARPGTRRTAFVALSISGLVLTSILTRPASAWTSSRTVTTVGGTITPSTSADVPDVGVTSSAPSSTTTAPSTYAASLDAASWIQANVPREALLATDNPVTALVPALTGYRMYIAGNIYQAGLGAADELDDVWSRTDASVAFGSRPSADTVRPLCAAGVTWAWVDGTQATVAGVATVAYANEAVTIMRLQPEACP